MKQVFLALACLGGVLSGPALAADTPRILVDPGRDRQAISPWIYGTNQVIEPGDGYTALRFGGNRSTAYNWENNASNAGSDWKHSSDDFLTSTSGIPGSESNQPGIFVTAFREKSLKQKIPYALVTLQMAGYVAADKKGTVETGETAPSNRWKPVFSARDSDLARAAGPEAMKTGVFMEDLVKLLIDRFGKAGSPQGIRAYLLDNEPALWNSTHARMHPQKPTCMELAEKGIDMARMVKRLDAGAEVYGPEAYGFAEYMDNGGAPDWSAIQREAQIKEDKTYLFYLEWYLDQFRMASQKTGTRLLDVLSIHWYPEARGGNQRINTRDASNNLTNSARMQAPRSLWDASYVEDSWIKRSFSWGTPLLPLMKEAIDTWYPGTKLALTEYNYGGDMHVSGGIAQADALGIFGEQGVYLATWWPVGGKGRYVSSAFRLYRNVDGKGLAYGDTAVHQENPDPASLSVHASVESGNDRRLHLVILNKDESQTLAPALEIQGGKNWRLVGAWGFDAQSYKIRPMDGSVIIKDGKPALSLPPLSACHVVLESVD